ncbi:major facilitator superfamily transporter [Aspergillus heteromorphus CBS 117.55]|uniref:Major facilitator superfamily transporter n=1 Tax=Aspergillus heteromorphus CBS 117.55 TaxID=1448321 RepID=A0A317WF28_9EURO|nr:major facilitator superfamily transporter [Aspergillus heteromorphus CBS 117.55]PWY85044.1 major facilitator superfamily transporter [Aspergillus heteromorphus CBS 117.55]
MSEDTEFKQEWAASAGNHQDALAKTPTQLDQPKSLVNEIAFVGVVCAAQLMTQAGLSLAIAPLHIISKTFNASAKELTWASAAYSLTVGTFILVAGRLGDVYGHRLLFIIGFSWFGLWSILAGFSAWSNLVFFNFCRAFQGIGPALLLPNAVAILGHTYAPGPRKNMVFSFFGATAPGGYSLGATFSSLFAERVWWPWGYWVMGIACFMFAGLGILVIPRTSEEETQETQNDNLHWFVRLDVVGATTGITALVLINFAWNQGPVIGWTMPYTYALLIVGFIVLAGFLIIERKVTCPLLPQSVFKGEVAWVLGCISAGWSSFGILVYYYYQFLEVIDGNSPLLATAKWAGASASGACAAVTTGFLLGRISPSIIIFIAMLAFTIGQIMLATMTVGQTYYAQAFVLMLVTPWGMDMSFPSGTVIMSNSMPREHQGVAGSLVNTVVNYSISLGLGFAGTVESYVNDDGNDILKGYRGASYMGVGLAGLGVILASCFILISWVRRERNPKDVQSVQTV